MLILYLKKKIGSSECCDNTHCAGGCGKCPHEQISYLISKGDHPPLGKLPKHPSESTIMSKWQADKEGKKYKTFSQLPNMSKFSFVEDKRSKVHPHSNFVKIPEQTVLIPHCCENAIPALINTICPDGKTIYTPSTELVIEKTKLEID